MENTSILKKNSPIGLQYILKFYISSKNILEYFCIVFISCKWAITVNYVAISTRNYKWYTKRILFLRTSKFYTENHCFSSFRNVRRCRLPQWLVHHLLNWIIDLSLVCYEQEKILLVFVHRDNKGQSLYILLIIFDLNIWYIFLCCSRTKHFSQRFLIRPFT
jgi:hypothetical protein